MREALCFRGVDFSYGEGAFAIKNLNFTLKEGEFVAVLGHNGSGKSTLARLANGLLTPTAGEIEAFSRTLTEKNLYEIRKDVGVVFQNPDSQAVASLVEDDVVFGAENVGLPREEIAERLEFALRAVGMEEYRTSSISRLSGGQKQRVAIAGVLALKPRVMILDESTAMLDPKGRREINEVVRRLNREEGVAVLLITHFLDEALAADRAVVLRRGEIVMEGTPREIFSRGGELSAYGLSLPRILQISERLRAGGLPVGSALEAGALADGIAALLPRGRYFSGAEEGKKAEPAPPHIRAEHLSHTYNEKSPFAVRALDDVSLTVYEGEFFGVAGHTGSGKSTFVQHLNGLIRLPSSLKRGKKRDGTVLFVGEYDLSSRKTDFRALRRDAGMVFQYPENQLFAETVFEDVAFAYRNFSEGTPSAEETERAVREALEVVGLDYESVKNVSPFDLSGGQKRRVAIAGVIVARPKLLILDEPAAGLDPRGKEELMALLHRLHADWCKTIVIVSHDMDELAEHCGRVAVFSEGKLAAVLPPAELFGQTERVLSLGLDLPLTAKLCAELSARGIELGCDYTTEDFVSKCLAAKEGAC